MLMRDKLQSVSKNSNSGSIANAHAPESSEHVTSLFSALKPTGISVAVPRSTLANFRIARAISVIESDYSIPQLNLEMVSQRVGLTKHYLCRIFKRELGIGLPEYVCKVRARAAEKLLQETSLSIKEITNAVGFAHVTQLDRAFKLVYGYVPREYRNLVSATVFSKDPDSDS